MDIKDEHISALKAWIDDKHLSLQTVGDIVGASHSSVSRWLSSSNKRIRQNHWEALLPHIQPYLHQLPVEIPPKLRAAYLSLEQLAEDEKFLHCAEKQLNDLLELMNKENQ